MWCLCSPSGCTAEPPSTARACWSPIRPSSCGCCSFPRVSPASYTFHNPSPSNFSFCSIEAAIALLSLHCSAAFRPRPAPARLVGPRLCLRLRLRRYSRPRLRSARPPPRPPVPSLRSRHRFGCRFFAQTSLWTRLAVGSSPAWASASNLTTCSSPLPSRSPFSSSAAASRCVPNRWPCSSPAQPILPLSACLRPPTSPPSCPSCAIPTGPSAT